MFTFNKKYFLFAVLLFIIEWLIAVFVKDDFFRPYFGDFLVVIFIYCIVRTVLKSSVWKVALGVLIFSYLIEILQYFRIIYRLGWENNWLARILIGVGFGWFDIVAYTLGILTILFIEKLFSRKGD